MEGLEGGTVEEKGLEADGGLEDAALKSLPEVPSSPGVDRQELRQAQKQRHKGIKQPPTNITKPPTVQTI